MHAECAARNHSEVMLSVPEAFTTSKLSSSGLGRKGFLTAVLFLHMKRF